MKKYSAKKVLIISTVGLGYDGITNVILSYLRGMNLKGLDIYIASTIKCEKSIKNEIEKLKCQIIELPSRQTETIKYFFALESFIRKNSIEVIHAHGNSGTLAIELLAGWFGGCKKRIAHSHNTKCDYVKADKILRPIFNLLYTDALACGNNAGKWLFGKRPFTILFNGRDIELFTFNEELRKQKRRELRIENEIVVGHVGGFTKPKNYQFLLDIYRELLKMEPSIRLVLIGDGPLKDDVKAKADDMKNNLLFVDATSQVADYLQAMDGMLLPSLYEGLPLVALEWQINGLPCILSDVVTKECAFADNCKFMSLENSPEEWAKAIIVLVKDNERAEESRKAANNAKICGFDIKDNAKVLRKLYLDS